MKRMIDKINIWIDHTLKNHAGQAVSCESFSSQFKGFYSPEFLSKSYYVVVDKLPKPDFPELRAAGFGDFIDMDAVGITYKNTFFIKKGFEGNVDLHFHELVHVLQWQNLGALLFIERYMREISYFGYRNAPLEKMAYGLQEHFSVKKSKLDILSYVKNHI